MTKPYIILLNGTLWRIQLPEKPVESKYSEIALKAYERARSAAIENKIEVENPEIVTNFFQLEMSNKRVLKEGEEILWPGTVEIIDNIYMHTGSGKYGEDEPVKMKKFLDKPEKYARLIAPEPKQNSMTKEEAISQIRAGKLAIENDGEFEQLLKVLNVVRPERMPAIYKDDHRYMFFWLSLATGWHWDDETDLIAIKVTELIQLMEEKPPQHTVMGQGFHIKKKMSTEKFDEVLGDSLKAHGLIEPQPVPQLRHTDNQREAWEAWEEDQKTNPNAVNPQAFVYGYSFAKNKYTVPQLLPSENSEAKKLLDLFFENKPDEERRYSEVIILELMESYRRKPLPLAQSDQEEIVDSLLFLLRSVPEDSLKHTILQRFTITRNPK